MYYRLRLFSASRFLFLLLRLRRAPFTAHCVLQWILVSAIRVSYRGLCFTVDFDLRFRIASDLQWILDFDASTTARTPRRKKIGSKTGDPRRRVTPQRAPSEKWQTYTTFWLSCSESDERIKDSALRLFRRRDGLLPLFLARFQDSSNV